MFRSISKIVGSLCYFTALCFFFSAQLIFAAPIIIGTTGTFGNGEAVTVFGDDFTNKSHAAPLISSYDNNLTSNNWSNGVLGSNWRKGGNPYLTNSKRRVTFKQGEYTITYNNSYSDGGYDSIRYLSDEPQDKMYVSFWMYRDNSTLNMTTGSGDNAKFLRIYQSGNSNEMNGDTYYSLNCNSNGDANRLYTSGDQMESYSGYSIAYSSPAANAYKYSSLMFNASSRSVLPKMRTWQHYEYYMDYPSTEGGHDGFNIALQDGATVARTIDIAVNEEGATSDRRYILIGQVSGGFSPSYNEYIDQVYIDNTPAHIYISDSPNAEWPDIASFNHSEIQVASAWSDNSITFTFNQGTFNDGATVYLYVVDINGNCNAQGFPVTIGNSSGQSVVPAAPENLKVNN